MTNVIGPVFSAALKHLSTARHLQSTLRPIGCLLRTSRNAAKRLGCRACLAAAGLLRTVRRALKRDAFGRYGPSAIVLSQIKHVRKNIIRGDSADVDERDGLRLTHS